MLISTEQLTKQKEDEGKKYILTYKEWGGVINYTKRYTSPYLLLQFIKQLEQEMFCSYKIEMRDD